MSSEKSDYSYFDESTSILVPIYIVIAFIILFGTLFS